MLFTIGTEYFIFVNNANNLETQSLVNRGNAIATSLEENLAVTTSLNANGHLELYFNDTGGQAVNVTSMMLLSSAGALLDCYGVGLPASQGCGNTTPALPQVANAGTGAPLSGYILTNYTYSTGSVVVKLVASDGSIFTSTYPPTSVSLASKALSSGAIGDLYLAFSSYSYYIETASCASSSTYCLSYAGSAFSIPTTNASKNLAFSIQVTNLDPEQKVIVLDKYSLLMQFVPPTSGRGGGTSTQVSYYIISNSSLDINQEFSPIQLAYDVPTTIFFGSTSPGTFNPQSPGFSSTTFTLVFAVAHGCIGIPAAECDSSTYNYGQNLPYVGTLYHT